MRPARTSDEPLNAMDGSTDGNTIVVAKRWRKRFLVPTWITQLIALAILSALAIRYLAGSNDFELPLPPSDDDSDITSEDIRPLVRLVSAVTLAISCIASILTTFEILLYRSGKLHPVFVLVSSIIKLLSTVPLAKLGLIYLVAEDSLGFACPVALALLWFASFLELIYGAIMTHRWRRGRRDGGKGVFSTPGNPSAPLQSGTPPMATTAHSTV